MRVHYFDGASAAERTVTELYGLQAIHKGGAKTLGGQAAVEAGV